MVPEVRSADDNVLPAHELQEACLDGLGGDVIAGHLVHAERQQERIVGYRVNTRLGAVIVILVGRIDLQNILIRGEAIDADVTVDDVVRRAANAIGARLGQVRVRHDHLGERVLLQRVEEVLTLRAGQVVEAVAVLQIFHLRLEDRIEGRAEHAAERHGLFGKAADPEVDVIEAAGLRSPGTATAGEEVDAVSRCGFDNTIAVDIGIAEHEQHGGITLFFERGRGQDRRVLAVGRQEVDG